MTNRKLTDGSEVPELQEPMIITIKTRCPEKWMLIDRETGEVYTPHTTQGTSQWKKIATGNLEFVWD